ncbi:MAG: hypothetical protein ACREGE_03220 [Candidatus Microsaccharimonas sp.]
MVNTTSGPVAPKSFIQGRVYDLVVCILAVAAVVGFGLTVPFGASDEVNRTTAFLFVAWGAIIVASALLTRHLYFATKHKKTNTPDPVGRVLFGWFLPVIMLVAMSPWILSGVFDADDMNKLGASALILFLGYGSIAAGILVAALWSPIEMTIRGLVSLVKSKGEKGAGLTIIGLYFMVVLAFIVVGINAASTQLVSYPAYSTLLLALFGLPGEYEVKNESLLWVTRILGIIMVVAPFIYGKLKQKYPTNRIIKDIDTRT